VLPLPSSATTLFALGLISTAAPLVASIGALALLGIGFALFSAPNTNAVMSAAPRSAYGVASAVLATMRLAGNVLSMGVVTLILARHLGGAALAPPVYPGFVRALSLAFPLFGVLSVVAIFASLARGNPRREATPGA